MCCPEVASKVCGVWGVETGGRVPTCWQELGLRGGLLGTYLCVIDRCPPKSSGGPGDREHGPRERQDGENRGEVGSAERVVEDGHKIAQRLRAGHARLVQGEGRLHQAPQAPVNPVRLLQLVVGAAWREEDTLALSPGKAGSRPWMGWAWPGLEKTQ